MAAVVLAAGRGRRFGGGKLLAPFRGQPLAAHSFGVARQALEAGVVHEVVVVVAAGDDTVRDLARRDGARTVVNDAPDLGLSSSLRLGLAALGPESGAVVLLLADQPLVRVAVMARLADAWRRGAGALLRPRYADTPEAPGHPVLVDRSLWPLALELTGETGFASLLPAGSPGVGVIDVGGANPDIDTPGDLTNVEGSSS